MTDHAAPGSAPSEPADEACDRAGDEREAAVERRERRVRAAVERLDEIHRRFGTLAPAYRKVIHTVIDAGIHQIERNRLALDRAAAPRPPWCDDLDREEDGDARRRTARERQLTVREATVEFQERSIRAAQNRLNAYVRRLGAPGTLDVDDPGWFERILTELRRSRPPGA